MSEEELEKSEIGKILLKKIKKESNQCFGPYTMRCFGKKELHNFAIKILLLTNGTKDGILTCDHLDKLDSIISESDIDKDKKEIAHNKIRDVRFILQARTELVCSLIERQKSSLPS